MNMIKGIWNRMLFELVKFRLKSCGTHSLFERRYELIGAKYIAIGSDVRTKPRLHLTAIDYHNGIHFKPIIEIKDNVSINYDVHIAAINKVIIGEGTLIASKVFITDHFHGNTDIETLNTPPSERKLVSRGPVIIGKNVWIGEGVAIMPGVIIGDNCVIGANAVVTSNIPSFSIAAGVPAKVVHSESVKGKGKDMNI